MTRASWGSRLGFMFAVAGSAVGLANIWRFPYILGSNGGAAFLLTYLASLFAIGFPVFIAEVLIGRTTQTSPSGAFLRLGRNKFWQGMGKLTILTGFIVSSFYSAVAGWILGYLMEALRGNASGFTHSAQAVSHYANLIANPVWGVAFHLLFLLICSSVLYMGVRNGIEKWNEILMPMLFITLILLVLKGLTLDNAREGLRFLFTPDWSALTPAAIVIALGQSFFTLSLGQGTMVTYGSYLNSKENVVMSCFPILIMDTLISILAAIAVFTIAFSGGMEPDSGPGLLFHTLPWIFSQIPGGYFVAILFFLLVLLAAITSEISAMEPAIAYLMDEWGWTRHNAVIGVGIGVFLLGIPSALSGSLLSGYTLFDMNFLGFVDFLCSSILIPVGGLLAVLLVGWRWGTKNAITHLKQGAHGMFEKNPLLGKYFYFCFKYVAPALIVVVFIHALGVF